MKGVRLVCVLAGIAALLAVATGASAGSGKGAPPAALERVGVAESRDFVPGELLVRFREGVSISQRRALLNSANARVERTLGLPGLVLTRVPEKAEEAVAAALERRPEILYAEPNFIYRASAVPDDPGYPELWALPKIDTPAAWDSTTGSRNVVVAVVDSGVDYTHLDLAANSWKNARDPLGSGDQDENGFVDDVYGWDFVDGDNSPLDFNDHGTHVAGTIGARGNNLLGVTGVNWQVSLMAVRALDAYGSGTNAGLSAAMAYAASNGARVVNGSFGGPGFSTTMRNVIADFPNVLFVVAAGNGGSDGVGDDNDVTPMYPCNYDLLNLICVAATDTSDALTSFSNFGLNSVDLAAPGSSILSTIPTHAAAFSDSFDGTLANFDGTWGGRAGAGVEWGRDSFVKQSGTFSLADSPGGAGYANNSTSSIRTLNDLNLAGKRGCAIDYALRLATEFQFDFFLIEAATSPGGPWRVVAGWTGSTGGAFFAFTDDLSAFDTRATVYLRFSLLSDGSVTHDGANVDDLVVRCLQPNAGGYESFNGTSMAAPHVAGVAALVLAANPRLTVAELRDVLLASVDPLASLAALVATGGRLNAFGAVSAGAAIPPPGVRIGDVALKEGHRGTRLATLVVRLSAPAGAPVTVRYRTANGTAKAPSDYRAKSGRVTFKPGQRTKRIAVTVKGDRRRERNETFFVRLSNAVNAIVADKSGRGLIRNDD